jgi:predicted AAA+ superfamily ATPase
MLIKRKIIANIWENIDNSKIFLLNGARQVGKTTILKIIKQKLIQEKNIAEDCIFWYDLEKTDHLQIWSSQTAALSLLPIKSDKKYYIFIDEFQKSKNIGSILKVLHDHHPNFKIIITGSATWYLNIDESLAGRKKIFPIWPLSFSEFIEHHNDAAPYYKSILNNIETAIPAGIEKLNNILLEFLAFGGYPEVVLAKKNDKIKILSELLNSYLTRDIQIWNYTANSIQVKNILTLLSSQVGSLLETSNLSNNSGLGRTALMNRLELLENTFILYLTKPFFTNKIKELTKNPKIFLIDTGFRNMLLGNFSVLPQTPEFGRLAENFAATELAKNLKEADALYFWRTPGGQEVDLILKREGKIIPAEVKSGNESAVPSGLKSFIHKYSPEIAYVLNWTIIKDEKINNTKILFRPLWWKI